MPNKPTQIRLPVANPSPFWRNDYVEIDLGRVEGADQIPDDRLRLYHRAVTGTKEIPFQLDYPFGRDNPRRVLTFFSDDTPPAPDDYSQTSAEFYLEDTPGPPLRYESPVWLEHFYTPTVSSRAWDPTRPVIGVKMANADAGKNGLEIYISLVPHPRDDSPLNYAGAVTSILHQRAAYRGYGHGAILSPILFGPQTEEHKARWGQLTRLDLYPLPWEPRWYHTESMLDTKGQPRAYSLVWSGVGPHHATIGLRSTPFTVRYDGGPVLKGARADLTCRLYRRITLYPDREYYCEQLAVIPDEHPDISLAFRAHYAAHVDVTDPPPPKLARLESIPDYFAVWREWRVLPPPFGLNLGYGFASDSHIRALAVNGPELTWRLQLGHEHRCVHSFLYEPHEKYDPFHTVGHDAWYLRLFKPLEVRPLTRYTRR